MLRTREKHRVRSFVFGTVTLVFSIVAIGVTAASACNSWDQVIRQIYIQILGRDPLDPAHLDQQGFNNQLAALDHGTVLGGGPYTVKILVRNFVMSQEYWNINVTGHSAVDVEKNLYQKLLGRQPTAAELNGFGANSMPFGPWPPSQDGFAHMVDAIMNSTEYKQMFGGSEKNSNTLDGTYVRFYEPVPGGAGVIACVDTCQTNGCGTIHITDSSTRCDGATSHADCHCDTYLITSIPKADCISGGQNM